MIVLKSFQIGSRLFIYSERYYIFKLQTTVALSEPFDDNMFPSKRKHSALEKTPISMLQELCDQEKEALAPSFEPIAFPTNSSMFICTIKVFDVTANAMGSTKKEAKHKACADIIGKY